MNTLVGILMGSKSDWKIMANAAETLDTLGVPCETRVISAHRTPDLLMEYASSAADRGLEVLIAGAGMAAHLAGVTAAKTTLPVLGVPLMCDSFGGMDALLSMVQMPAGVPVATFAVGKAGAVNAALFATMILSKKHTEFAKPLDDFRAAQREKLLANTDPRS